MFIKSVEMKAAILFVSSLFFCAACSTGPNSAQIEATVSARLTQVAIIPVAVTALPAEVLTAVPQPTVTPRPTSTPNPTKPPRPTSTPEPEMGTRKDPHPLGFSAGLIQAGKLEFEITFTDVKRGDKAWSVIYSANQFNDKPPEGMEYIVATVEVAYTGADEGPLSLELSDWSVVTNGQALDWGSVPSVCCLTSEFDDIKLFSGGKAKGIMAWPVYQEDLFPMLVIGMGNDGTGGVYFALQ